ncbi:MAG: DUF2808 domain-containing protein [Cyanobacteriota bacterium]|nr:DUF2808 domain-containing protein [Cyanobacteriota bacterium]
MALPLALFRRAAVAGALMATLGSALGLAPALLGPRAATAQGTSGLMEFRWDNTKDYRRLYFFITETVRSKRSDYYLILRPKDLKTAMLKLRVVIPSHFDSKIDPKNVQLCYMQEGGMTSRTRCKERIPATVEVADNGSGLDIFPDQPVPAGRTVGVFMTLFNPSSIGMYQFNALVQAPGDVPMAGYVGSWLIQIDATNN